MKIGMTALMTGWIIVLAGCGGKEEPKYILPDTAAQAQAFETLPDGPGLRVLFLGNSLTDGFGRSVPALVKAMAEAGGVKLEYLTYAPGMTSLEDHWRDPRSRQTLTRSRWDYVVLQQGPSTLRESQAELKQWATTWAEEIRKHNAKPVLYMVQPEQTHRQGFRLVSLSYRKAATAAGAQIAPAGEAWEEALRDDPELDLYSDGLHATKHGVYLSALVITHELTGVKPSAVPDRLYHSGGQRLDIADDVAVKLRQAAEKAIARNAQAKGTK
jgi:hypothetical protein